MYSVLKSRLIAGWLIENMNPEMTSNKMLLDVSESWWKRISITKNHMYIIYLYTMPTLIFPEKGSEIAIKW